MEKNLEKSLLFSFEGVQLFEISSKNKKFLLEGTFELYNLPEISLFLIKIEIPVLMSLYEGNKMYIIPYMQDSFYGIVIKKDFVESEILECLEQIFSVETTLIDNDKKSETNEFEYEVVDEELEVVPKEKLVTAQLEKKQPTEKASKIANFISVGSDKTKKNIISAAKYLGKKVSEGKITIFYLFLGGEKIKNKITKKEEKKIKPETVAKVKTANVVTGAFLSFSRTQMEALIDLSKKMGNEMMINFYNTKNGQKIKNHKEYENIKVIGTSSLHAIGAVYTGMTEALGILMKEISKTSVELVDKKYGKDSAEVTKQGLETMGNVGDILRVHKDVIAKKLEEDTKNTKKDKKD